MIPPFKYYALMLPTTKQGAKTPRYTITKSTGNYPQMASLIGRDGLISMYLKHTTSKSPDAPPMMLQAKDSYNFTGLKEIPSCGDNSKGFAFGYPYEKSTYGEKNKTNHFFSCCDDGYMFIYHYDQSNILPKSIELIAIEGGKPLIGAHCSKLKMGSYDKELDQMRKLAL